MPGAGGGASFEPHHFAPYHLQALPRYPRPDTADELAGEEGEEGEEVWEKDGRRGVESQNTCKRGHEGQRMISRVQLYTVGPIIFPQ